MTFLARCTVRQIRSSRRGGMDGKVGLPVRIVELDWRVSSSLDRLSAPV